EAIRGCGRGAGPPARVGAVPHAQLQGIPERIPGRGLGEGQDAGLRGTEDPDRRTDRGPTDLDRTIGRGRGCSGEAMAGEGWAGDREDVDRGVSFFKAETMET